MEAWLQASCRPLGWRSYDIRAARRRYRSRSYVPVLPQILALVGGGSIGAATAMGAFCAAGLLGKPNQAGLAIIAGSAVGLFTMGLFWPSLLIEMREGSRVVGRVSRMRGFLEQRQVFEIVSGTGERQGRLRKTISWFRREVTWEVLGRDGEGDALATVRHVGDRWRFLLGTSPQGEFHSLNRFSFRLHASDEMVDILGEEVLILVVNAVIDAGAPR